MLSHDVILSGLVRGRSLSAIGAEDGVSRQAIHCRLNAIAKARGLTRDQLWEHVEAVLASERCDAAGRMATTAMSTGKPTPRMHMGGRWQADGAIAELDSLADDFMAGRWNARKLRKAQDAERVLLSFSFTR